MKKVISGFLVLALMLFNIPSMVLADDNSVRVINSTVSKSGKCGDKVYWKLYKDGTLEVYGNGPMWDYGLDGEPGYGTIYSADRTMYTACSKSATNVVVRDGVTTLGRWAFPMYKKLTKVDLSECNTLVSLNDYAIGGGPNVVEVIVPSNVKNLNFGSFYGLAIDKIDLSHTKVEEMISPFTYCVNLKEIVLPKTLKKMVGATSFIYCYSLKDLYIPSMDVEIGDDVFTGITSPVNVYGHINSTVKAAVDKANNPNVTFIPLCTDNGWELETLPTCTTSGREVKACVDCGVILDSREVKPLGHLDGVLTNNVEPSCKEDIVIKNYCAICGEPMPDVVINKIQHTPSDWIVDNEPTCEVTGHKHKECKVCKEVLEKEEIPKKSHSYVKQVVAPTCVEKGYSIFKCACGHFYIDEYVSSLGHTPSDWIVDIEPTCNSEGSRHKECLVCKEVLEKEVLIKKSHTPSKNILTVEPTCDICGKSIIKCLDCGEVLFSSDVNPLGHNPSDWIVDKEPTCEITGHSHKECTVCKTILEEEEIPKKNPISPSKSALVSETLSQKISTIFTDDSDNDLETLTNEIDIDVSNINSEDVIEEIVEKIDDKDFKPKTDGLIVVNVGSGANFSKKDFESLNKVTSSNVLLKTSQESSFLFTPSNAVLEKSEELVGKLKRVEVVDKINDTHYTFTYTDYEEFSLFLKPVIELSEDYDEAWLHYYSNVNDYFDYTNNLVAVDHVRENDNYLIDINSSNLYNSDIIVIDDKYYKNTIIDRALRALDAI